MSAEKPILSQVRKSLLLMGASEMVESGDDPMLQALWDQMQDLRTEMNEAKKDAAAEAAKPYLEAIEKIEKRYGMYLKLKSTSTR